MPRWVRQAILLWWGVLVGLFLILAAARQLRGLLVQVVLALFFSFAMETMVDRLGRRGIRRGPATALTMFTVLLFFVGFLAAMGRLVAGQLQELADDLPGYITDADIWLSDQFNMEIDSGDVVEQLQAGGRASEYLSGLADNLLGVGTSVLNVLFQLLTISLFAYYFTADGPRLRKAICSVLPPARQHEVLRIWELAINKTGAFIASRVILAIVSAAFHWLVFAVLELPSSLALGLWVGLVSQFIPVIGTYIAGVVPALIALGVEPRKALFVIIAVLVYQQIENYILQPRVTAQTLDMHPAVAFAAVLAGTATFGVSGALLALPFLATVQSFISAYIARHNVVESYLLESDAEVARARAAEAESAAEAAADAAGEAVEAAAVAEDAAEAAEVAADATTARAAEIATDTGQGRPRPRPGEDLGPAGS
jgi:predicted PurR-regulated permease PerM